jgi:pilus assembly protein Flp/PilA
MRNVRNRNRKMRRGQAMVEYTIILAAVTLVSLGAMSLLGHKTGDMLGTVTAILPGAHTDDNGPIAAGELVNTVTGPDGLTVDVQGAANAAGTANLNNNLFGTGTGDSPLLLETPAN